MPIMMKTVMAPERTTAPVQRYTIDWDGAGHRNPLRPRPTQHGRPNR